VGQGGRVAASASSISAIESNVYSRCISEPCRTIPFTNSGGIRPLATMSNTGLSYGLNIIKRQPLGSRPAPGKRKPIFDEDDDSGGEDAQDGTAAVEVIGEMGGFDTISSSKPLLQSKAKISVLDRKPTLGGPRPPKQKMPVSVYGDLSANFTSKKHATTAEEVDPSIYDYDGIYDSLKPKKVVVQEDAERKPKYMTNLMKAADIRKRDALIAEEKKLAREREAEGDEFADKEKFVTSAYKKQQEENRRLEEAEKIKEAEEERKNKGTGMTAFYKNLLEQNEAKHSEIVRAAEERAKAGPVVEEEEENEKMMTEEELAKRINEQKAGAIAVNDSGEVVDKRQLLMGGLNIIAKPKSAAPSTSKGGSATVDRNKGSGFVGAGGGKQAMRERQSRMLEAQLEQATKRAREDEEEEQQKVERVSKSRKTEGEVMGAKGRYLARKREAEEAKKRGDAA